MSQAFSSCPRSPRLHTSARSTSTRSTTLHRGFAPEAARMCTDERVVHPRDAVRADPVALRCTTDAPHTTCPSVRARHHQPPGRAPEPPRHPEPASGPPPHPGCTSHPIHPAGQPDIPSNAPFSPRNSEREGARSLDIPSNARTSGAGCCGGCLPDRPVDGGEQRVSPHPARYLVARANNNAAASATAHPAPPDLPGHDHVQL